MSRLGKLPITIPKGTTANVEGGFLVVKGPKGELKEKLHSKVRVELSEAEVKISVNDPENKKERALWGLFRSLANNMVKGVNEGFAVKLELNGVGYRVSAAGDKLNLSLGFSHPVVFPLPKGINGAVENNLITLSGFDKRLLGETAARLRRLKEPEPYKGKGLKYVDEVIRRKEGKTAAK